MPDLTFYLPDDTEMFSITVVTQEISAVLLKNRKDVDWNDKMEYTLQPKNGKDVKEIDDDQDSSARK